MDRCEYCGSTDLRPALLHIPGLTEPRSCGLVTCQQCRLVYQPLPGQPDVGRRERPGPLQLATWGVGQLQKGKPAK